MGRENPQCEPQNINQEIINQPGTGTLEPEKTTKQPGHGTQVPDVESWTNQPGMESRKLHKNDAVETPALPPPMNFQAMPVESSPTGPSVHGVTQRFARPPPRVQRETNVARCRITCVTCPNCADGSLTEKAGDVMSLMARGRRSRLPETAAQSISDMPQVAQQEDPDDEDLTSSDDDSSVSDPNWQNTVLFSVIQPAVTRFLSIPHVNLRRMQIASALHWATDSVVGEYPVSFRPADLVDDQLHARLVRHTMDLPPRHTQQLVLVDVEFHPPAPQHEFERIRLPIYALQFMTAIGFLRSMYLIPYCNYAQLPCFLWRNGIYWSIEDDAFHQLRNGDYVRIVVPPPNPPHQECHPRALASALHMGFHPDTLEMAENLIDENQLQAMPNPYRIILSSDAVPDPMEEVQNLLQLAVEVHQRDKSLMSDQVALADASLLDWECPRMQATLGHHNACGSKVVLGDGRGPKHSLESSYGVRDPAGPLLARKAIGPFDVHASSNYAVCPQVGGNWTCPRMQATLGQNNACRAMMLFLTTRCQPRHYGPASPEQLDFGTLASWSDCPRIQATLGNHDACLHGPSPCTMCGFPSLVGLCSRSQLLVQLAICFCCVSLIYHSRRSRSKEQSAFATLDDPQLPEVLRSKSRVTRASLLHSQEFWVALDEIKFYLKQLGLKCGISWENPCVAHPDCSDTERFRNVASWYRKVCARHSGHQWVASALLLNNHWIPILICMENSTIYTTPAGRRCLVKEVDVGDFHLSDLPVPVNEEDEDMCGFRAIFAMQMHLGSFPRSCTGQQLRRISLKWRQWFGCHLLRTGSAQRKITPECIPFGGAGSGDVHAEIVELLQTKGVPATEAEDRAKSVLLKLGRQPLAKALRGQNPWREVKQLANLASPKVQLVLPSELEAAVQERIATGAPFGDRRKKSSKPSPKPPLCLNAEDITIPDGIFRDAHQAGVSQIAIEAIGPEAQGVVVVNADQAAPYLRFAKPVSKYALALVVVNYQSPLVVGTGEEVRFPARCERTAEPILLTAKVIQIGNVEVTRAAPTNPTKVEEVSAVVVKTCTYRDELQHMQWEKFRTRPLKYLVEDVPCLQPGDQGTSPIIDVWDRQWLNDKLERVRPEDATLFCVCFRVERADLSSVLAKQGKVAHYVEPRSPDGRTPHGAFRVIWINKKDRQGVMLAAQQTAQWTSIVRSGARFGLRVNLDDAQAVHEFHKPNTPFLATDDIMTFHAGPFPHGSNRNALVKLFATWGWQARPSQPKSRAPTGKGVVWEVQAVSKPPYEVYQLAHADILITQVEKKSPKRNRVPNDIQGSARTLAALAQAPEAPPGDPWDAADPWSRYQGPAKISRSSPSQEIPPAQLESIVSQVSKRLLPARPLVATADSPDAAMGADDRVVALEDRMSMIEQTMQDQHKLQTQVTNDLAGQIGHVQQQVDRQTQAIHSHIDSKMQEQLTHVERLLSKRRAE